MPDIYRKVAEALNEDLVAVEHLRPIISDILRENITQHVKDSYLGYLEIVANLLPKAIAVLNRDLESRDPLEATRAAMFIAKLMGQVKDLGASDMQSPPTLTVVTNVEVPNTKFGQTFVTETEKLQHMVDDDSVEMGECYRCHEYKPTEAMNVHDSSGDKKRYICKSCYAMKKNRQNESVTHGLLGAGDIINDG